MNQLPDSSQYHFNVIIYDNEIMIIKINALFIKSVIMAIYLQDY